MDNSLFFTCFCLENILKGGGRSCLGPNFFKGLFVVVCVWKFLIRGGVSTKSKLYEELYWLEFGLFLERGDDQV